MKLKTIGERRVYARHSLTADIVFSYFNKEPSYHAQTMNLGSGGMCFKSDLFHPPGATLFIRVQKIHPDGFCTGFCEGLRTVTLAEIKWCKKESDTDDTDYGVGVKYFESVY
jgi:hypothetical protein